MNFRPTSTWRRPTRRACLGYALAALCMAPAAAQVNFSQNFNLDAIGWTGNFSRQSLTVCSGFAMRRNLWSSAQTGQLISPSTGTTLGNQVTVSYNYRCANFDSPGGPTAPPWGSFTVQYGATATGPWTNIATVANEPQTASCISKSHVFTPPAGPLFLRWSATWATGSGADYWLIFDDVDVVELVGPCSGTPAPGNTTGPTAACAGNSFTLGLQNATSGTGISYQWYASTSSGSGPWTAVGPNAPTYTTSQTVTTWYYCDVTCATGPSTGSSNVWQVDIATPATVQDFSAGVVASGCWTVGGNVLPIYAPSSAHGVGTGSARLDFWNFGGGTVHELISPLLSPTAAGDQVFFDAAGAIWSGTPLVFDTVEIEESNNGGASWSLVVALTNENGVGALNTGGAVGASFVPSATQWRSLSYALTPGTDRVRFRGLSAFGNNVYLDNIYVGAIQPAKVKPYGAGCGAPPMSLLATPHPVSTGASGTLMSFNISNIPLACPSPAPVFHFGVLILSLNQDLPGSDLLAVYSIDSPGCNLHVLTLDATIDYVGTTPSQSVAFNVPPGVAPGFELFAQAAALICPAPPNNAGVVLSNAVSSFVNSY